MSDRDALAALQHFSGCCGKFQLQQLQRVGFSGSSIWKVSAADDFLRNEFPGPLCLKRWPADQPPPARLPWIHQVLKLAREQGIAFVPEFLRTQHGATVCEVAGSTWELMTWLPGEVDQRKPSTERRVAAAFRALARFHIAVRGRESLASDNSAILEISHCQRFPTPNVAPAIADRMNRWEELRGGRIVEIRDAVQARRIPLIDELAEQWVASHSNLPHETAKSLQLASQVNHSLQPAIRDLWRDHVLFSGDEVSGLIDFGAMRIDTPLTDLARLMGSLAGDDVKLRNTAIAAYSALRPLTPRDVELIDLLDHTGTLIAGWNWLDWLYVEQRHFSSLAAVRERLSELFSRNPQLPLLGTPGRGLG